MINVSEALYRAMQKNTNFKQAVTLTLKDSTVLNIPQSKVMIQGNSITTGAGASSVPLGMAVGRAVTITLNNLDESYSEYDFTMARLQLDIYYPFADSTEERISYGVYTVLSSETQGSSITITAMDDMYKADREYTTALSFPVTALRVLTDACTTCGIALETASFLNDTYTIKKMPENTTFREVIGGLAALMGGNAFMNRLGRLEFKAYDVTHSQSLVSQSGLFYKPWEDPISINGGSYSPWSTGDVEGGSTYTGSTEDLRKGCHILYAWTQNPTIDTDDITITGVAMEEDSGTRDLYGTEGYILVVSNPIFEGDETAAVALIGPTVTGLKFRMFSGTYVGDPTIEFMDDAVVIDAKGRVYSTFITDVTYNFRGTTELKNSAEPVLKNSTRYTNASTRTLQRANRLISERLSAYDIGIQNLTNLMSQSIGFYKTEEVDPVTGSTIWYMHDAPLLEDSTLIYKRTLTAYAQSTDGGQTWNSGVDIMGNAVMNTVAAKGLSADWITAGSIEIADENNIYFLADYATNRIKIFGRDTNGNTAIDYDSSDGHLNLRCSSFSLQGNSISSIAATEAQTAISNADVPGQISNALGTLTQQEIFDRLTNNNANQGIWLQGGHIYINMSYLQSGVLRIMDQNNQETLYVDSGTGEVRIRATTFSLSGQSISTIAANEASTAISNANISGQINTAWTSKTQAEIFDKLTNGSQNQGIWLGVDGTIYINMSYLQTGILQVKDSNNTETLYVDSGTGEVRIRASSFSLAGQSISQIAASEASNAISSADIPGQISTAWTNKTQAEIFNKLTNNGTIQGLYMEGNQLYINWAYGKGGTLALGGTTNGKGVLEFYGSFNPGAGNGSNKDIMTARWDNSGLKLYSMPGYGVNHTLINGYSSTLTFSSGGTYTRSNDLIGSINLAGTYNSLSGIILETDYNIFLKAAKAWIYDDSSGTKIASFEKTLISLDAPVAISGTATFNRTVKLTNTNNISSTTYLTVLCLSSSDNQTVVNAIISASSKRYKDIDRETTSKDVESAYGIKVYQARYKDGYLSKGDQREGKTYPMFVAEQMQEYLPIAVDLNKEGTAETWNERVLIPIMFQMIKDQHETIERQQEKIDSLEQRLARLEAMIGGM